MSNMISLTIDGMKVEVPQGTTVLKAAKQVGIDIPTLCYLEGINQIGSCRLCVVDAGRNSLLAACTLVAEEGMDIKTNTSEIREARKLNLELILSNHNRECLSCPRNQTCELQKLCNDLDVDDIWYEGEDIDYNYPLDYTSHSLVRDPNKCILCRRCVAACETVQGIGVIGPTERGFNTIVEPVFRKSIGEVKLHQLRSVRTGLPRRRSYHSRRHKTRLGRSFRPRKACSSANCPRSTRRTR